MATEKSKSSKAEAPKKADAPKKSPEPKAEAPKKAPEPKAEAPKKALEPKAEAPKKAPVQKYKAGELVKFDGQEWEVVISVIKRGKERLKILRQGKYRAVWASDLD